jgi:hypothetical protein
MLNTISGMLSGGVAPTDFESIQSVTVGGAGAATISFTSIPSTYTHLQIRGIGRSSDVIEDRQALSVMINSDNGTNYVQHNLSGNGSSAAAQALTGRTGSNNFLGGASVLTSGLATANIFGMSIIDILDYTNTNKYKVTRSLAGQDQNSSSGRLALNSCVWLNTAAITSLSLSVSGGNFVQYSSFALYGIR